MKKRNYEERSSPINKQKSIVRVSNLHYSVTKEQLEVNKLKFRTYVAFMGR
jgi:hypothetical protein